MAPSSLHSVADYDEVSSPDPLATSTEEPPIASSPSKPRRAIRHKKSSSQSSRASTSFCQQFNLPAPTMTDRAFSPWNIRVTVEAEPDTGMDEDVPIITRTTRIPLREISPDTSQDTKVGTSTVKAKSPARSRQRSATPSGEPRRRHSVTNLDIIVLGDDADENEWGIKRGSPRKKKAAPKRKELNRTGSIGVEITQSTDKGIKSSSSCKFPEGIDINRVSPKQRTDSVKRPFSDLPLPTIEIPSLSRKGVREVSANSTRSYLTPSPTPSEQEDVIDAFDTIMESEGFTMIDLDSIASVRQLRSSPADECSSVGNPGPGPDGEVPPPPSTTVEGLEYPKLPCHSSSRMNELPQVPDGMTSSPPIQLRQVHKISKQLPLPSQRLRQITPITFSSPRLPSPPRASSTKRTAPDSVEILMATRILQSALDSKAEEPAQLGPTANNQVHARSSSDELLKGFDSQTQREMRAGLRFGEELAKRQPNLGNRERATIPETTLRIGHVSHRVPINQKAPEYRPASTQNEASGAQLGEETSDMSTPAVELLNNREAIDPSTSVKREQQWQLERNEVIKAIQEATPNKVIVIDSDEEDETTEETFADTITEDEGGDIWLAEAKDSSSSPRVQDASSPRPLTVAMPQKPQPRQIPSSWKQENQLPGNESNISTNGEGESGISGLFWRQAQDDEIKFGARQLKTIRRELKTTGLSADRTTSGSFDLEKMMSPPKRCREPTRGMDNSSELSVNSEKTSKLSNTEVLPSSKDSSTLQQEESPKYQRKEASAHYTLEDSFKQSTGSNPSPIRPSLTPRSALKNTRHVVGDVESSNSSTDQLAKGPKAVVWARRSTHVDEDWIESSRSINTEESSAIASMPQNDGPNEPPEALEGDWQVTSKHASLSFTSSSEAVEQGRAQCRPKPYKKLPSYLRPPSYPSDPTRSVIKALSVAGNFSDTHFRTLHIIYRKAQRPRFHGPNLDELRPQIRKLVDSRWTLDVDEDHAGLGGFKFKFGEIEGRVLERFCREVELGHIENVEARLKMLTAENGIWGGVEGCDHGRGLVAWGWDCEQLATWLGRIVIGEVVREEEYQGSKH